jgi:hypothetical protein
MTRTSLAVVVSAGETEAAKFAASPPPEGGADSVFPFPQSLAPLSKHPGGRR